VVVTVLPQALDSARTSASAARTGRGSGMAKS